MKCLVLSMMFGVLVIGCAWFDNHNDIEYPVQLRMDQRYGDPVSLWFYIYFTDQTEDDDGVLYEWSRNGDTLLFSFDEQEGKADWNDVYYNTRKVELCELESDTYTLIFECSDIEKKSTFLYTDTLILEVEDSAYHLEEYEGDAVTTKLSDYESRYWSVDIRKLFPDMILVEVASYDENPSQADSFRLELLNLGADLCSLSYGDYTLFQVNEEGDVWVPLHNGVLCYGVPEVYCYSEDTIHLVNLVDKYRGKLKGLSLRSGSGFSCGFGMMMIE